MTRLPDEITAALAGLMLVTCIWLTDLIETRGGRVRRFMPRCRTCKALSAPCDQEKAWVTANRHHDRHPTHKVSVTPVRA